MINDIMDEPTEDIIWDTITDSAKTKINYADFSEIFDGFGNDILPNNILFNILVEFAGDRDYIEVGNSIKNDLLLIGLMLPDDFIEDYIKDAKETFNVEIEALLHAYDSLEAGLSIPGVLVSVRSKLMKNSVKKEG